MLLLSVEMHTYYLGTINILILDDFCVIIYECLE